MVDCFKQTIKNEGLRGLYKGMASPLVGIAFVNAILFGAYAQSKSALGEYKGRKQLSLGDIAIAGGFAGLVNTIVACPIELVKTKLQVQYNNSTLAHLAKYKGPMDCCRQLVRQHGLWHGLFSGMGATVAREVPAYAAFYSGFEFIKRKIAKLSGYHPDQLPGALLMLSGACGGICYWSACYPFDVIKSKIQSEEDPRKYRGVIDCGKKIVTAECVRGLFKGFAPCITRTIPAAAVTFTAFEYALRILNSV